MQYGKIGDLELSRLALGTKRMPTTDITRVIHLDFEEAALIADAAVAAGITHFETSYSDHKGEAEAFLGGYFEEHDEAHVFSTSYFDLVDPRFEYVFDKQQKKLKAETIDLYYLESVADLTMERDVSSGAVDYFIGQREAGRIANLGFASEMKAENLQKFAGRFEWDFVRLRLNYFDWFMRGANEQYQAAIECGLPILSHGTTRVGSKPQLKPECVALLKEAHADWTETDWALRFVKGLEGVQSITCNMHSASQVEANAAVFEDDATLSSADMDVLQEVAKLQKTIRPTKNA